MIGFIGLGKMGMPMASHLLCAGETVMVTARKPQTAAPLLKQGAHWSEDIKQLASQCRVVFTMIGSPTDVQDVFLSKNGLVNNCASGTTLVDMSTSSPALARRIDGICQEKNLPVLDAPVTGGVRGAQNATLTFMVGGQADILKRMTPLFKTMGQKVFHMGPAGAGQTAKSCNQIAVAGIVTGMAEALRHANNQGLSAQQTFDVLSTGTASSPLTKALWERLLTRDNGSTFSVQQFAKDLQITLQTADQDEDGLSVVDACLELCNQLISQGRGDAGLEALLDQARNDQRNSTDK